MAVAVMEDGSLLKDIVEGRACGYTKDDGDVVWSFECILVTERNFQVREMDCIPLPHGMYRYATRVSITLLF